MSNFLYLNNNTINNENQAKIEKKLHAIEEKHIIKSKLFPIIANFLTPSAKTTFPKCGDFIAFDENAHITRAYLCHSRYCPICNYLTSAAKYAHMINLTKTLPYNYIFITATIKNCKVEELNNTLQMLSNAFKRYANRKPMKGISQGYFRATEITYNAENNTFHPHIHMLVAVPEKYYETLYTSTYEWRIAWESAARLTYTCQFDVQAIKDDENMYKATAEICKYVLKMTDILYCKNDIAIETLIKATKGKRMINTSGCFRGCEEIKITHDNFCADIPFVMNNGKYTIMQQ